ncbi:ankyrin [Thozetella sp. PMI_491]|nr:ankyrin [Thozetella sp. PMI_491]
MTTILDIPVELLLQVVGWLDPHSQFELAQTNSRFHAIASRVMYEEDAKFGASFALFWAAYYGRRDTLIRALAGGAEVNAFGPLPRYRPYFDDRRLNITGNPRTWSAGPNRMEPRRHVATMTPLHWALKRGHEELVPVLLDHGADIDAPSHRACPCTLYPRNWDWRTPGQILTVEFAYPPWRPLHLAICQKLPSAARLLIARGASPVVAEASAFQVTAMQSAAAAGLAVVIKLLHEKHGPGFENDGGQHDTPPLHHAMQSYQAREIEVREVVLELHRIGADLNFCGGRYDTTPLVAACITGKHAAALALLELGVRPEFGRILGYVRGTLLHLCALDHGGGALGTAKLEESGPYLGLLGLVKKLIELGADLEARCGALMGMDKFRGSTPLQVALSQKDSAPAHVFRKVTAEKDSN